MHMLTLSDSTLESSNRALVKRSYLRYLLAAVFMTLTFETFKFFPGMAMISELWLVVMLLFLLFPYLYWKAKQGCRFSSFELYLLIVILFIPLLSGFTALKEFGQPLIYGLFSQRGNILGLGGLALIFAFRNKLVSLRDIQVSLILLAWLTLGLYLFMQLFLDPESFASSGFGFVNPGTVEDAEFKLRSEFIIIGFFYYAFLGFRNESSRHWLLSAPFLGYLIAFHGGRSMILSVIVAFIFFTFRWGSSRRRLSFFPKLIAISIISLGIIYVINADFLVSTIGKFGDAFTVILSGEETGDASANARIGETALVMPFILKNWLIGSGSISHSWNGGYEGVLGSYFFPSDIGILGVIFMYGLVGVVLFGAQFVFAFKYIAKIPGTINSSLGDVCKGYLLYFAIHSLVTGRFVHYFEISVIFIAVLGCIAFEARNISTSETSMEVP